MLKVAIIIGSTRPGRKAEVVARWVYDIANKRSDAAFEIVDIKDFNLPLLDEPVPAAMGQCSQPHTKAWAAKIEQFDARTGVGMVKTRPNPSSPLAGRISIFRLRRDRSDEVYDWIELKNSDSIAGSMRAAISAQLRTDFAMTLGSACHSPSGAGG